MNEPECCAERPLRHYGRPASCGETGRVVVLVALRSKCTVDSYAAAKVYFVWDLFEFDV